MSKEIVCIERSPSLRSDSFHLATSCSGSFSRSSSRSLKSFGAEPNVRLSVKRHTLNELAVPCQVKNTFINLLEERTPPARLRRCASAPTLLVHPGEEKASFEDSEESEDSEAQPMTEDRKSPDDFGSADDFESREDQDDLALQMIPEELAAAKAAMEIAHDNGCCKPCQYFAFKADSCRKGDACTFCHRCTREEVQARRKAQKQLHRDGTMTERRARGWGGKTFRGRRCDVPNLKPRTAEGTRRTYNGTEFAQPAARRELQPAAFCCAPRPQFALHVPVHTGIATTRSGLPLGPPPGCHALPPRPAAALGAPPGTHWGPSLQQTRVTKMAGGLLAIKVGAVCPR